MKISKIAILSMGIGVLAIASVFMFKTSNQKYVTTPKIGSIHVYSKNGNLVNDSTYDVPVLDNLKDLYASSDCVVRGVVNKKDKSRNLSKNPENMQEDSKDSITISQEYSFTVTSWLKGSGNANIEIVYPDYTTYLTGSQKSKTFPSGNSNLKQNNEYILFLKHGTEGTYYGTAEPWQLLIQGDKADTQGTVQNKVKVISNVEGFNFDFDNMSLDDLLLKLK